MNQEKLIEGVVESYTIAARLLLSAMSKKDADSDEVNRHFQGLSEHRKTIKMLFKDNLSLEIYNEKIRTVLKSIRDDKDIYTQFVAGSLESIEDYYDNIDYLIELNGEYDLENVFLRRMEAGSILINKKLPSQVSQLFGKMRECYSFGFYEAAIIFCRALAEESIEKYYQRMKQYDLSRQDLDKMIDGLPLQDKLIGPRNELHSLRIAANKILHGAIMNIPPEKYLSITVNHTERISVKTRFDGSLREMSLNAIRATISLVEHLSH